MINLPEELKSRISIEDVVARYWEEPNRAHRVRCFAHNGKDRACLKPGDEYYNEARRAALVKEIKHRRAQLESDILYYTKRGQALPEYVNNARAKLVAYENELNA